MPLEGGEKLMAELKARANKYRSAAVDIGFFDSEIATIASINEYGAPIARIPARPFFRLTIKDKKYAWADELGKRIKIGESSREALTEVGRSAAQDVSAYISFEWMYIRNAKFTIKKKGFDHPLFETGRLRRSVRFRVRVIR